MWDLSRRSSWSSKDRVLGYISSSNHPYRPNVVDGVDVATGLSVKLERRVASVGNVQDIDREPSQTFHMTLRPD